MTPERWREVERICEGALACVPSERSSYVSAACGGDEALRQEVESLLLHEASAEHFIDMPAIAAAGALAGLSGLTAGQRVGPYHIVGKLGAGGMGEVYRARDTQLGREVAIKIVPPLFASDGDRLARFEREARVLASLNHPNIAQIHGLEKSDGTIALVMELVEGPTLADRIAQGAIPVDEALPIAKQIAEALEAAHEQGIVHRDLKPANIKVRPDGTVKVLDFGLAKALGADPASAAAGSHSMSPTITTPAMTRAGMILGTAAYMSPEQAKGRAVDKRSDVWAFGAVLYEMLTGRRAFPGEDLTDTLAAVVRAEPDWSVIPREVAPTLLVFLKRSLQKDARQRVGDIHDMRLAMEGAFDTAASQTLATSSGPRGRLPWIAALAVGALAIVALAIPAVRYLRQTPPPAPPETRLEIVTPATDDPLSFALSPDGRQIVYVTSGDGGARLWLRSLSTTTATPLAGTEGARAPFWSPDGRSVGFISGTFLKRVDLGGGAPRPLAQIISSRADASWGADGVILFAPSSTGPLMRVSATGGTAVVAVPLGPRQFGLNVPHFLPDGRRFLFYAAGAPDTEGIYLAALEGSAPALLTSANSGGAFLPDDASREGGPGHAEASGEGGWLLWRRAGTLVARHLDLTRAALTGEEITLAEGLTGDTVNAWSEVSVGANGSIAYRTGPANQRQLTWFDRSGAPRGTIGDFGKTEPLHPTISPDGHRVVVTRQVSGNGDLWLVDGARSTRLTFHPGLNRYPVWSPDGTQIVYQSNRSGQLDLYHRLASGAGADQVLLAASNQTKAATSWSPDGRFLLFISNDRQTLADLWVMPMMGDRRPEVFLKTRFREAYGVFSPDGRWVAYHSNESGRNEIYVRPFVPPLRSASTLAAGGQWQVSAAGGTYPAWRRDGKELYYLNPEGAMMAAPIVVNGSALEPGAPIVLFPTRIYGGGADAQQGRQYDVGPDGRFLINTELPGAAVPITLIQHWNPEAKR